MARGLCIAAVLVAFAGSAQALVECPGPEDGQILSEYLAAYEQCLETLLPEREEELAPEQVESQTKATLSAQPAATSGFASRVRDSIEDFLPLFGFAIDEVSTSDDGQSAVVRFNPIRGARFGSLALTATASESKPGDGFLKAVDEADRGRLEELAAADLDDFSNLTYAAKWGIEPRREPGSRWLLGRSYDRYRPFVEGLLLPALGTGRLTEDEVGRTQVQLDACNQQIPSTIDPLDSTVGALRNLLGNDFERCLAAWRTDQVQMVTIDEHLDSLSLIPFLIDNQPQLVLSAAVHDRDPVVDRDGWDVKLTFEKGFDNFNTLLRRYHRNADGLQAEEALQNAFWQTVESLDEDAVKAGNKLTFSLTYGERDPYRLERTFGEGDDAIPVLIDLDRATDWCGKIEYHRNATWHPITLGGVTVFPRLHFSAEYIDVSDDPTRQDRLVSILTYEIPLPSGTSLPVSLTYANHSEFLGEPDEQLSAHFGISYKLPMGAGKK
jgi:hypothetical protein